MTEPKLVAENARNRNCSTCSFLGINKGQNVCKYDPPILLSPPQGNQPAVWGWPSLDLTTDWCGHYAGNS